MPDLLRRVVSWAAGLVGRAALTVHLPSPQSSSHSSVVLCVVLVYPRLLKPPQKLCLFLLKKSPKQNQKAKHILDLFTDLLYSTAGVVLVLVHCHTWTQQVTQLKLTLLLMCHETLLRVHGIVSVSIFHRRLSQYFHAVTGKLSSALLENQSVAPSIQDKYLREWSHPAEGGLRKAQLLVVNII